MSENNSFRVQGEAKLNGAIVPQGAKNEALQILSAVLVTEEKVTITNVPDILDVRRLIALIKGLGVDVNRPETNTYTFEAISKERPED